MRKCSIFHILFLTCICCSINIGLIAQGKYWVTFKDKPQKTYCPEELLSKRAIERRLRNQLPLLDYSDFPVNEVYVKSVEEVVDSIAHTSKWMNGVSVWCSASSIAQLKQLDCVVSIEPINPINSSLAEMTLTDSAQYKFLTSHQKAILNAQTKIMGGELLGSNNLDGTGVLIAVFDVGFKGTDKRNEFSHLFDNRQIIATHDFIQHDDDVYSSGTHGTNVLSCIAGKHEGTSMGLATGASFILARTERNLWETMGEEDSWLAAAEWADSLGADVINSSLGYTYHRYFWEDLDGQHALVSRAAQMAFEKGMVVVNAAGNDGNSDWKYIGAPADAPGVLAVGGIAPWTGIATPFSSEGPTADGRLKPNVSAFGHVMACGPKGINQTSGTSFASPLVCGFVACIMQKHPEWSAKEVFEKTQECGHLYPYFDYVHGYGIPQAASLFEDEKNKANLFNLEWNEDNSMAIIKLTTPVEPPVVDSGYNYDRLRPLVYWHTAKLDGSLVHYGVIQPEGRRGGVIPKSKMNDAAVIRIHFNGITQLYEIN